VGLQLTIQKLYVTLLAGFCWSLQHNLERLIDLLLHHLAKKMKLMKHSMPAPCCMPDTRRYDSSGQCPDPKAAWHL